MNRQFAKILVRLLIIGCLLGGILVVRPLFAVEPVSGLACVMLDGEREAGWHEPITWELDQGITTFSGHTIASIQSAPSQEACFLVEGSPHFRSTLTFRGADTLTQQVVIILDEDPNSNSPLFSGVPLYEGDVDGDDRFTNKDQIIISDQIESGLYHHRADLNEDCVVDSADFELLKANMSAPRSRQMIVPLSTDDQPVVSCDDLPADCKLVEDHVVIMGSKMQFGDVYTNMVEGLTLIRQYPSPRAYLDETPKQYPELDNVEDDDLFLSMYRITSDNYCKTVDTVRQALDEKPNVVVEMGPLYTFNYIPKQLVANGECLALDELEATYASTLKRKSSESPVLNRRSSDQCDGVRAYEIIDGKRVSRLVQEIKEQFVGQVGISPNLLLANASENMISGSPAAQHTNAPPPEWVDNLTPGGDGIPVILFDSYPSDLLVGSTTNQTTTQIMGIDVDVSHSYSLQDAYLPMRTLDITHSVASHGIMVASQVLAEAADADVHIVRVLNDHGYGTLFTWLQAMSDIVSEYNITSATGGPIIFNHSLIVEEDYYDLASGMQISATVGEADGSVWSNQNADDNGIVDEDDQVAEKQHPVSDMLSLLHELGVTQIAAAGNNSASITFHHGMYYPGMHPNVLGVSALSGNGVISATTLSCYTNVGDVSFFGGGPSKQSQPICKPIDVVDACASNNNSDNVCITGYDPLSPSSYSWGVGSSFSSPRIAGKVAAMYALDSYSPTDAYAQLKTDHPSTNPSDLVGNTQQKTMHRIRHGEAVKTHFFVTNDGDTHVDADYTIEVETAFYGGQTANAMRKRTNSADPMLTLNQATTDILTGTMRLAPRSTSIFPATAIWETNADAMFTSAVNLSIDANGDGIEETSSFSLIAISEMTPLSVDGRSSEVDTNELIGVQILSLILMPMLIVSFSVWRKRSR